MWVPLVFLLTCAAGIASILAAPLPAGSGRASPAHSSESWLERCLNCPVFISTSDSFATGLPHKDGEAEVTSQADSFRHAATHGALRQAGAPDTNLASQHVDNTRKKRKSRASPAGPLSQGGDGGRSAKSLPKSRQPGYIQPSRRPITAAERQPWAVTRAGDAVPAPASDRTASTTPLSSALTLEELKAKHRQIPRKYQPSYISPSRKPLDPGERQPWLSGSQAKPSQ